MNAKVSPVPNPITKEVKEDAGQKMLVIDQAKNVTKVASDDDALKANALLKSLASGRKEADTLRKQMKKPIDEAGREIQAYWNPIIQSFKEAEAHIKGALTDFERRKEAQRIKEEAAAAEKHRKQQERLMKRADAAREKGQEEKAGALEMEAATTVAATPAASATKTSTTKKTWKGQVTDMKALCRAVADGEIPASIFEVKQSELDAQARANKDAREIPGVRFYQDISVVAR